MAPAIEEALRTLKKVRVLYHLGPDFIFTAGAIWDDASLGLRNRESFEKCALVTDAGVLSTAVKVLRMLMPCQVKIVREKELAEAKEWLIA